MIGHQRVATDSLRLVCRAVLFRWLGGLGGSRTARHRRANVLQALTSLLVALLISNQLFIRVLRTARPAIGEGQLVVGYWILRLQLYGRFERRHGVSGPSRARERLARRRPLVLPTEAR